MNGNGTYKIAKKTAKIYTVKTPFYRLIICISKAFFVAVVIYGRSLLVKTDYLYFLILIPLAAFAIFLIKSILYYFRYRIEVDEDRITYTSYFGKTISFKFSDITSFDTSTKNRFPLVRYKPIVILTLYKGKETLLKTDSGCINWNAFYRDIRKKVK